MFTKTIIMGGRPAVLACDGRCTKAWGVAARPRVQLGTADDDVAFLGDDELPDAPADPGTYEGGHAKPADPSGMNRWCTRQCERSDIAAEVRAIKLTDWSGRVLNMPGNHPAALEPT